MKNINPIERHVEKLVLGIGVLFAGWLVYKNFAHDPNQVSSPVQSGSLVAPADVGSVITSQVRSLELAIQQQQNRPINIGHLPNYVKKLVEKQTSPLPPTLVAVSKVRFGPDNTALALTSGQHGHGLIYMTAAAPALPAPKASQSQAVVYLPPSSGTAGSAGGNGGFMPNTNPSNYMTSFNNGNGVSNLATKGMFWVTLKTNFPMDKWLGSLSAKGKKLTADQAALPLPYHITAFYRVEVRRQRLLANGRWSTWKRIKGLYINPLPTLDFRAMSYSQRSTLLGQLDGIVSEILDPAFYATQQVQRRAIAPTPNSQRILRCSRPISVRREDLDLRVVLGLQVDSVAAVLRVDLALRAVFRLRRSHKCINSNSLQHLRCLHFRCRLNSRNRFSCHHWCCRARRFQPMGIPPVCRTDFLVDFRVDLRHRGLMAQIPMCRQARRASQI